MKRLALVSLADAVGAGVGTRDGFGVGEYVGDGVGAGLGTRDGSGVGARVGASVGCMLGASVWHMQSTQ